MKKIVLGILLAGLVLGGCGTAATTSTANELQQNVVTKTGIIQAKSAEGYLLNTSDGIVNITSTKVNLDNYMKKNITVTGMYSGDILYVDKIGTN
jgi:uncharacterized protein YceK